MALNVQIKVITVYFKLHVMYVSLYNMMELHK